MPGSVFFLIKEATKAEKVSWRGEINTDRQLGLFINFKLKLCTYITHTSTSWDLFKVEIEILQVEYPSSMTLYPQFWHSA